MAEGTAINLGSFQAQPLQLGLEKLEGIVDVTVGVWVAVVSQDQF